MNRMDILEKLDSLTISHCRTCPDNSRNTGMSEKCRNACDVGVQIRQLGDQMMQISSDRRKTKKDEVKEAMGKEKDGPVQGLTKKIYLEQIAAGETISSIERAWKLKVNSLQYWINKWGLKGIDTNKASALLENWKEEQASAVPPAPAAASLLRSTSKTAQAVEHKPVGLPAITASKEAEQAKELAEKLRKRNADYDRILLLNKELNEKIEEQKKQLTEMTEDRDHWKQMFTQAAQDRNSVFEWMKELEAAAEEQPTRAEIVSVDYEVVGPALTFEQAAAEIGSLVTQKNAAYGDAFAKTGDFLRLLYPEGIRPEQYGDALCLVRIFDKQVRIANQKDAFGESPYRDIAGYGILGVVKLGGNIQ